nr:unnamed protein product [Callosobruchus analis]
MVCYVRNVSFGNIGHVYLCLKGHIISLVNRHSLGFVRIVRNVIQLRKN